MRENRTYGSEGGAVRAVPTPIMAHMLIYLTTSTL